MKLTEYGKQGRQKSRLTTFPTPFENPLRIPTLPPPRRRVRCLGATAKTSRNLNSSPQLRKGLVTDVPRPKCNGCSGTLRYREGKAPEHSPGHLFKGFRPRLDEGQKSLFADTMTRTAR